jgi:uncharacterized protein YxjI
MDIFWDWNSYEWFAVRQEDPLRYTLKHKIFSIGGDSTIKDQHGNDIYFVDGTAVSLGRRLSIQDMQGHELATIHQAAIALTPTFEIHEKDGVSARASMKLPSLRVRLKIDVTGSDDLEAHGNLLHRKYEITRGHRQVAHVSKRWIALADTYSVEIDDDQDQVLLLACAVVIDEILEMY